MKLKFFISTILLSVFITVCAQERKANHIAEETVLITADSSATLHNWFAVIEKKGIILSYNSSMLDLNRIISVKAGLIPVNTLLKKLLSDYHFTIIPSEKNKLILQINGRKPLVLSGIIKEEDSEEKLYGASVRFSNAAGESFVTLSDDNGYYNIELPIGRYQMDVNYMGYHPLKKRLFLSEDTCLVAALSPVPFPLEEVVVKSRTGLNELNEVGPSNLLSFSSSDLFSQIKILPGVLGSPVNGDFQVNGGSGDENLILLDGIPVYHINHLNSMLPAFNGDAIKNVAFHKSFFPAQFEGRLSSVTDVKLKDGNKEKYVQTLTLDMPAASAVLEGPIIKNKLSYMVAGRRSWLDFFDNLLSENFRLNHSFYDFNVKLSYDINNVSSLQASAYKGADNYYSSTEKNKRQSVLNWKNEVYALKYNTVIKNKVVNTNSFAYTNYTNRVYAPAIGVETSNYIKGGIKGFNFASDFGLNIDNIFNISGGIKASVERFDLASVGDTFRIRREPITQLSFFYSTNARITDKIYAQVALNFVAYMPKNHNNYFSPQPRFSFKYSPSENHFLYADFSRMEQFYHYIRLDALPLPTDFRMPSIKGFKPSTSEHYEVGWKYFMKQSFLETSLYYKRRHNIMALRPDTYPLDDLWNKYIMTGSGESYGIKLHYYGDWKKFMLQFSYTFSRSKEWFPDYKEKKKVPSLYDVPHICNLALTYKLNSHSGISLGGNLRSGRIIDVDYDYDLYFDGNYEDILLFRTSRHKINYRLDASYNFTKEFEKSKSKLFFRIGLYNIIGNPSEEDYLDFYSIYLNKHCIPYGSITFKF